MDLRLVRATFLPDRCIGSLWVNGLYACDTLEDKDRKLEEGGTKVPGKTAIPRGRYKVTVDFSNRFKRRMIHVLDVPQFDGIRIHAGNTPDDTEGCILVGEHDPDEFGHNIVNSRVHLSAVQRDVESALSRNEAVWLEVV